MKKIKLLVFIASVGLALASCSKYDGGGNTNRADKKISKHTWVIESYYYNGVDKTSQLLITGFEETFNKGGSYVRTYTDASGDLKNETGNWSLDDKKMKIGLSGPGSYELTAETSTVSASSYDIIRLKKDELWYSFENGGSKHEFHMKAK